MASLKVSALAGAAAARLPIGVPGWFAADPVGPAVPCLRISRNLVPDQALQAERAE